VSRYGLLFEIVNCCECRAADASRTFRFFPPPRKAWGRGTACGGRRNAVQECTPTVGPLRLGASPRSTSPTLRMGAERLKRAISFVHGRHCPCSPLFFALRPHADSRESFTEWGRNARHRAGRFFRALFLPLMAGRAHPVDAMATAGKCAPFVAESAARVAADQKFEASRRDRSRDLGPKVNGGS